MSDQVEQQLAARLGEGQIAELIQNHQVEPDQVLGDPALASGPGLGFEPVDQIDRGVEAGPRAAADATARDGDRQVALAGAGAADQHGVALLGQEGPGRQGAHQALVDRRSGKLELAQVLGQRHPGQGQLILDALRLSYT